MVEVTRSGEIESFHQGVAVLINSSGEILKEWGLRCRPQKIIERKWGYLAGNDTT